MSEKNSNSKTPDRETKNLIANTIRAKLDALMKEVKERRQLEKECLDALKNETRATVIELDGIMRWTLGADPTIEKRRLGLEDRLWRIRKEIRDQKVNFWRDTQTLKREIRSLRDVYEAVKNSRNNAKNKKSSKNKNDKK